MFSDDPVHTLQTQTSNDHQPQFKETDLDVITRIVRRYAEQDTWKTNLNFEKESFELLQDILTDAGELKERVPYEKLVTVKYTENRK